MQFSPLKYVTIIIEEILKDQIQEEGMALGATGYSTLEVQGLGSRGARHGTMVGSNVQISFIVPEEVAEKILAHVSQKYLDNYAGIGWMSDVAVVRGERYVNQP